MLHAGSEIFHDVEGAGEGGSHVDIMMTSPVEKNCEWPLTLSLNQQFMHFIQPSERKPNAPINVMPHYPLYGL